MKISKWLSSGTKKANNAKAGGKPTTLPAYRYRLSPMGYVFRASEERPPIRFILGVVLVVAITAVIVSYRPLPLGPFSVLAILLFVLFALGALYFYARVLEPHPVISSKNLCLLGTVVLLSILINRFLLIILQSLSQSFPFIPLQSFYYTIPVALGSVLLTVLFNTRIAFGGAVALSLLTKFLVTDDVAFLLFGLVGAVVGAFSVRPTQDRTTFFKAGFWVAIANCVTVLTFIPIYGRSATTLPFDLGAGLVNGVLVALFASTLLPVLEYLFETATDLKLLELSNLNRPLLKQLMRTAPGTYHHSLMMGELAEAAAEAIGANPLLCRVGAYYHDIGKVKKPVYFIENHMDALKRHEKLSPHLSSLIVVSHVKEGIELALEHRLPPAIVDLIPQHHGTRLVTYFYEKAKESQDPDLSEVKEEDYRYPGPKPQTREAAILMLADAVEAAARTLNDPTPARIQGLVQRLANSIFIEGELSECDLTLKDLHQIAKAFVRVLTASHHHRVDYPGYKFEEVKKKEGERKGDGDTDPKPAKEEAGRPVAAKKGGGEDIKRLGQTER
ncbi:MAG: HDIG domain-containing protein [candidate division NC10 bacterium]|nr:HDIG domain-containing protein [candidate division NC10 bacterium]